MQATRDTAGVAALALDYDDPVTMRIDPDTVIRQAKRRLRARWMVAGMAVLVAGTAAFVARFGPAHEQGEQEPASLDRILAASDVYRQFAPAGPPVVVDASVPGWDTVVWISAEGGFCEGPVGVAGNQRGQVLVSCTQPFSLVGPGYGEPPVDAPVFHADPASMKGTQVLAVGFARTGVARVSMVFLGTPASATVEPVTANGRVKFGVYAIWLSPHGATSYGSTDISALTGYDSSGRPVR